MNLPPFRLERFFARHEFTAPHLLCVSDGESVSVAELLDLVPGAAEGLGAVHLGYTDSKGSPVLRQAIASLYTSIEPDDVLVHVGAEEAIFTFMTAALTAGDTLAVTTPCYQSLSDIASSLGCRISPWRCDPAWGFAPDMAELGHLLGDATKVLAVNFPHNPTGYLPTPEAFAAILALAAERGVRVFSDEVYRFSEADGVPTLPAACDLDPRAVSLGVMSKSFGLAGLRVGWVCCRDRELLARMGAVKDYLSICGSAPSEYLAACALTAREALLGRMETLLAANRRLLGQFFLDHSELFHFVPPRGGLTAFPGLRQGTADGFCQELLAAAGVLLLPGSLYGDEWPEYFRIGFGRADFAANLERMAAFCQNWNPTAAGRLI
ncbi:aminotransferase class I/II-fold pyridoxal phosphate-dependent enzyme [Desulfovibrio sp. TomC]|uniref:aminotransferase class I/II-fold pyridoxal phosphate-dependent enzyme n=1 Tax=Desulfovibrio sp. TomC TaxID=1562888 RepID=UPI00057504A4|nr:aminotransferase class I/II-fold pyridoxal phosphate-dependent enzyme [Desulfovibrio sp. TomC]KHK01766.1 aminotransferase, classes I and II [Desulfovibrio sp. TomC]